VKQNLANIVTIIRIVGVGILVLFFTPFATFWYQVWAVRLYWILVLSDTVDGRLARSRFGKVTKLGKVLDPVADKLLFLIYLPLILMKAIHPLPVIVLFARDILIDNLLRNFASSRGKVIAARVTGKVKTVIAFILAGVLLARIKVADMPASGIEAAVIGWFQSLPSWVVSGLTCSMVAVVIISGVDYLFSNRKVLLED